MYQLKFKRALLAILVGLLPACSTVQYVRELPPEDLLADCPVPVIQAKTNGQLVTSISALELALAKCNVDKESLRKWAN